MSGSWSQYTASCDAPSGGGGTGGSGDVTNPEEIGVGLASQIVGYTYAPVENDVISGVVYLETLFQNETNTYSRELRYIPVTATDGTGSVTYNQATHGDITAVDSDIEFSNIVTFTRCDDLTNDVYENYVEAFRYEQLRDGTFTSTSIGTFTDSTLTTIYNPVNTIDCDSIGDDVLGSETNFITLEGVGSYASTTLTNYIEVHVINVNDMNNPPTITTNSGTHKLYVSGGPYTWGVTSSSHLLRGTFIVNSNVGDIVSVVSTELTTS